MVFGHLYALSNNPATKFGDWVAYEVDVVNFGDTPGRKWLSDPLLDSDSTLEPSDYKGAANSQLEADRGHQAPLASFAGSRYWSELNYLSNITPQDKDLNQGPWKNLEEAVRAGVSFRNSFFVITGPLYKAQTAKLPKADESHKVPSAYFKIVYKASNANAAGFIMPQSANRKDNYCNYSRSMKDIQGELSFRLPRLKDSDKVLSKLGC